MILLDQIKVDIPLSVFHIRQREISSFQREKRNFDAQNLEITAFVRLFAATGEL